MSAVISLDWRDVGRVTDFYPHRVRVREEMDIDEFQETVLPWCVVRFGDYPRLTVGTGPWPIPMEIEQADWLSFGRTLLFKNPMHAFETQLAWGGEIQRDAGFP